MRNIVAGCGRIPRSVVQGLCFAVAMVGVMGPTSGVHAFQEPKPPSPRALQGVSQVAADGVVAVVNGDRILESELQAGIRSMTGSAVAQPEERAAAPGAEAKPAPAQAVSPELRSQVLTMIIDRRLIEQFVIEQRVEVEKQEIDRFVERVRQDVEEEDRSFAQYLQAQGQTEESLRRRATGILGWQKYLKSQATDEVLKKYFEENKRHFDGTQVRVQQILWKVPADADKEVLEKLFEQARAVRQEILEKKISFADAARTYSQSPSAKRGGDLGYLPRRRRMFEPFARTAFDLNAGEVSEPLLTPQGLHLITVSDLRPGEQNFDGVKDEVSRTYAQELEAKLTSQQREKSKIEIAAQPASS